MKGLISVSASGEHCVLATNFEDSNGDILENSYTLMLCNALGTPLDTKQVRFSRESRVYELPCFRPFA